MLERAIELGQIKRPYVGEARAVIDQIRRGNVPAHRGAEAMLDWREQSPKGTPVDGQRTQRGRQHQRELARAARSASRHIRQGVHERRLRG